MMNTSGIQVSSQRIGTGRAKAIVVWALLVWCGWLVYDGARPEVNRSKTTAMDRDSFRPDWHAGKLGESFANQTFNDGICSFFAFSKLLFLPPETFQAWQRVTCRAVLPPDSYLLFLLESSDLADSFGFRVSRSDVYPTGLITFQQSQAVAWEWTTLPTLAEIADDQMCEIRLERQDASIRLFIDDKEWGAWANDVFPTLSDLGLIAGPTGMKLDVISVEGVDRAGNPVVVEEDFAPHFRQKPFFSLWLPRLGTAAGLFLIILIVVFLSGRLHRRYLPSLVLTLAGWLFWSLLQIVPGFGGIFLALLSAVVVNGWTLFQMIRLTQVLQSESESAAKSAEEGTTTPEILRDRWLRGVIALLSIVLCLWSLWYEHRAHESTDSATATHNALSKQRRIRLGAKYEIEKDIRNFEWKSSVGLRDGAIAEWVLRKYRGPDSEYSAWYSLTLSRDPDHVSGIYSTRQNYQVKLKELPDQDSSAKYFKVEIRFVGDLLQVQVNDMKPISLLADERDRGEVSLVPITDGLTIYSSDFNSVQGGMSFSERLRVLWPSLLIWSLIILALALRWEVASSNVLPNRRTFGLLFCLVPFPILVVGQLSGLLPGGNGQLILTTIAAVLLVLLMSVLANPARRFVSFGEIVVLLICLEGFLRIDSFNPRLQENPIQANIPPHLYWYRAASARRWNSYIKHNMFRNGVHYAPFTLSQNVKKQRIMCLGSSSTAGGYPSFLQEAFVEDGNNNVEVIDGGVPGTTSVHLVNFYRNCLVKYKPDIVTICLIRNDMKFLAVSAAQQTFDMETSAVGSSPLRSHMYYWLNRSMLYRLYRFYILSVVERLDHAAAGQLSFPEQKGKSLDDALVLHEKHLRSFVATAREYDQQPMFIIEPFFVSDGYDVLPEARKTETDDLIHRLAQELDIPVIDMQKFMDENRHSLFFIDDVHHNDDGKKFIGRTLFKSLSPAINQRGGKLGPPRRRMSSVNAEE